MLPVPGLPKLGANDPSAVRSGTDCLAEGATENRDATDPRPCSVASSGPAGKKTSGSPSHRCDPGRRPVYNPCMTVFRYGREHFEEGEYVRRTDATPGDDLDPVVRIVEDLGTVEIPCGKVDCRSNCLEYMVRSFRRTEDYALADCKLSPLISII